MQASMASGVVDICLIPEVPFSVPKLCAAVEAVLDRQGDCVVCVAEGAGQDLAMSMSSGNGNGNGKSGGGGGGGGGGHATDASGNPILEDVGAFLKQAFKQGVPGCDCKYIGEESCLERLFGFGRDRREREKVSGTFLLVEVRARSRNLRKSQPPTKPRLSNQLKKKSIQTRPI